MHLAIPDSPGRIARWSFVSTLLALTLVLAPKANAVAREATVSGVPVTLRTSSVFNLTDLARLEMLGVVPDVRPLLLPELPESPEPEAPLGTTMLRPNLPDPSRLLAPQIASPPPSNSFMGLDDIPMVDSSYIIIPPDVDGAVGISKIMQGLNNNYRILNKSTGATISTVGTATFWAPTGAVLNALTDPRTIYDPYNCRWITVMQTIVGGASDILVGVSKTSDPSGGWWLYRFLTASTIDFPTVGFNKNWIVVSINQYNAAGTTFLQGISLVLDYPQARVGVGTGTLFTMPAGTHFAASPAATYSPSSDTLYVIEHLSSGGATYDLDRITGTPGAPVYTITGPYVRPGGGWVQPGGNISPQAAPLAGVSACAPTPCRIESQDARVRSAPVYRNGQLWYSQTIGLPVPTLTHTAVQWTQLALPAGVPVFVQGGRIEDPTATNANGGKWYNYSHIAVNAAQEFIVGYTQYSSAQYPSSGYSMQVAGDALNSIRDPLVYHAGEDYYHKTFTTATGRNRWGDYSKCQVDPCDDMGLWTVTEYAKLRTGTNDGNTGANSSKWSTWWAVVNGPARVATVTCPLDTLGTPGSSVTRKFRIVNGGAAPDQFSYSITDAAGWGGPVSGTTPVLAPASFFDVFVTFNVPLDCNPTNDLITLSAVPLSGCNNCYTPATCQTRIFCDIATATLVSRFDARLSGGGVDLSWASDAVGQVEGWNVYRAPSEDAAWARVNTDPIAMRSGGEFRLHDDGAGVGTQFYRLAALMPGGREEAVSTTQVALTGPSFSFAISGSNPFNRSTTLRYSLPKAERVQIDVFSVSGQRVRTLVNRFEPAGVHSVDFALREGGRSLTAGVYMIRISAGPNQKTVRAIAME